MFLQKLFEFFSGIVEKGFYFVLHFMPDGAQVPQRQRQQKTAKPQTDQYFQTHLVRGKRFLGGIAQQDEYHHEEYDARQSPPQAMQRTRA